MKNEGNFYFLHLALLRQVNCISKSPSVYNAFLLCLTSFYYLNEWSDTKLVNTIFVKTAEPHQATLDLNSKVVWLRSKWGLKLTYFSNFAILGMFRTSQLLNEASDNLCNRVINCKGSQDLPCRIEIKFLAGLVEE